MKIKYGLYAWCLLGMMVSLTDCTPEDTFVPRESYSRDGVQVKLSLFASDSKELTTRADADPLMTFIDNVHVLLFSNGADSIANTPDDTIVYRDYFHYGVEQNIYLKSNQEYRLYVVANLDASNTNIDNAEQFFTDVTNLGKLREKYVIASSRSVEQIGKMVMTTDSMIPIKIPETVTDELSLRIPLTRLNSKVIFNVYNKVHAVTKESTSGVRPISWNVINTPNTSYLVKRKVQSDGKHDHPTSGANDSINALNYNQSVSDLIPVSDSIVFVRGENSYLKQTFHLYTFENRRGTVSTITDPKQRKSSAPVNSTFVQINGFAGTRAIVHYVHIGEGRITESEPATDDFKNFDVERSCIYHMNVYINGVDDISTDSRREMLNQHVILMMPDISRIDGHFIDVPLYVAGMNGYVKLQSGIATLDGSGQIAYQPDGITPVNFEPMSDAVSDSLRWLRISFNNPYKSSAKTALYASMNSKVDAYSGATPIMHFHEYLDQPSLTSRDPLRRTAAIRVGYVAGALTAAEYDQSAQKGSEYIFYLTVSQHGIKTIGRVGGYDGIRYATLLGVESVEESAFAYYTRPPNEDIPNNGPVWNYNRPVVNNNNQPYDGKKATTNHYNDFRSAYPGGIPPKRGGNVIPSGTYNPVYNTNAADYCIRKNRDENDDGIISDGEVKWYLPTPAQLMQLSIWRDDFNYTFNPRTPFNTYYWSTNELVEGNQVSNTLAYALNFAAISSGVYTADVLAVDKNTPYPVRCVRDIPGGSEAVGDLIYKSGGTIAVDLTDYAPGSMLDRNKTGLGENELRTAALNAKMQKQFIISRWYLKLDKVNHTGIPFFDEYKKYDCPTYSEADHPAGGWVLPSQRELSFMYANSGMIEDLMKASFPEAGGYDSFIQNRHWAITNNGNNSEFWSIDFASGNSQLLAKSSAYFRCVKYLSTPAIP